MEEQGDLLIYGYGNPGCQDDGLGVLFAERCERLYSGRSGFHVEINYQLNVEDAYLISGFKSVIFADAALPGVLLSGSALPDGAVTGSALPPEEFEAGSDELGFYYYTIKPAVQIAFSTHAMSPQSILGLCEELYHRVPRCHIMHIEGKSWEFDADPTEQGLRNLDNAWEYFKSDYMSVSSHAI